MPGNKKKQKSVDSGIRRRTKRVYRPPAVRQKESTGPQPLDRVEIQQKKKITKIETLEWEWYSLWFYLWSQFFTEKTHHDELYVSVFRCCYS